jgi:hypothetical protein
MSLISKPKCPQFLKIVRTHRVCRVQLFPALLYWTVPTIRGGTNDDVQYVEQTNVLTDNNTDSGNEKDETILNLHKSGQEQADEIAWLNLQLTDLASRLLLVNNMVKDEERDLEELEIGLAEGLGNEILNNLQRLLAILHEFKLFQEPWLPTYTKNRNLRHFSKSIS